HSIALAAHPRPHPGLSAARRATRMSMGIKVGWTRVVRIRGPINAQNARTSWQERDGAILCVSDDDGRVGVGEASPLPGFSPDTIDACTEALGALHWDSTWVVSP